MYVARLLVSVESRTSPPDIAHAAAAAAAAAIITTVTMDAATSYGDSI